MDQRAKVESALRKKEKEIQGLEEKIKATEVYVKALRDVLKMLDMGDESATTDTILRQGSAVDKARQAILDDGNPMHINDLVDAIGKEQTRESRSSLVSSLAAYVRRNEIFVRTAPNTFGLLELGHRGEEDQTPEPPAGFGQVPRQPRRVLSTPPARPANPQEEKEDDDDEIPF